MANFQAVPGDADSRLDNTRFDDSGGRVFLGVREAAQVQLLEGRSRWR